MKWYEKLKFARKVLKLSQRDIEEKLNISNAYLCQLETGKIENPSFFIMMKLIKFYNLEVDDFIKNTLTITQVVKNVYEEDRIIKCKICGLLHDPNHVCPQCVYRSDQIT